MMKTKFILMVISALALAFTSSFSQVKVENSGNVGIGEVSDPLQQLHIKSKYDGYPGSTWGGIRLQAKDNTSGFIFRESSNDECLVLRNNSINTLKIKNGNVAIGPEVYDTFKLYVDGNVGATHVYNLSDERLKENINLLSDTEINDLYKLEGISYNFNAEELKIKNDPVSNFILTSDTATIPTIDTREYDILASKTCIGFSAQELQKIYPELVTEDDKGYLSIDYISLIPVIVEALKEQQEIIIELLGRIARLEENKK